MRAIRRQIAKAEELVPARGIGRQQPFAEFPSLHKLKFGDAALTSAITATHASQFAELPIR